MNGHLSSIFRPVMGV